MQFLEHGPDIPNELVNALLNDNAVFFCGAGVSGLSILSCEFLGP